MAVRRYIEGLSEPDIEAIHRHPRVRTTARKVSKALEAITGWRLTSRNGVPKKKFKLIVVYEDALGALKEAIVRATYKRMRARKP